MWTASHRLFKHGHKDEKAQMNATKSPDIDEEYYCAIRTKSYADFLTNLECLGGKGGDHLHTQTSIMPTECILEPGQETIRSLLPKSSLLASKPELKALIDSYFDASAEAAKVCSQLLKSINKIQSTHQEMQFVMLDILECDPHYTENFLSELSAFAVLENPFAHPKVPTKSEFGAINEKHTSLLLNLRQKRKKMARRLKLAKFFNKATLACLALAFSAATTVTVLLAVHTLAAFLMGPIAIFTLPRGLLKKVSKKKKRVYGIKVVETELLKRLRGQLDMAAKGTYILNRDFDTMSRLVMRMRDEVEWNKAMAKLCLERKGENLEVVEEVVKEIRRSQLGLRKQADELEEYVCLSLLTINRARAHVIKEIVPS